MAANRKIELQADALMERLNVRLATATYPTPVTKSYSSNNVLLSITQSSTDDAGPEALIYFKPADPLASGATDALGLTQTVYSPHLMQVAFDIDANNAAKGATPEFVFTVLGEVFRLGMDVELFYVDGGLEITDITSGTLKATFRNLDWGSLASV